MPASFYQRDSNARLHRGAICDYRSIFWLDPPLWIVRVHHFHRPRDLEMFSEDELQDAFQRRVDDNQEYVLATAKRRPVIILSNDVECKNTRFRDLLVAPMYSLHADDEATQFIDTVRITGILNCIIYLSIPPFLV